MSKVANQPLYSETPATATSASNSLFESVANVPQSAAQGEESHELTQFSPSTDQTIAEDESHYPSGLRLFLIMASVALVLILGSLDSSVISVAVPTMTDQFHTVADVGWYSAVYRLCTCAFQFMFGKLYRLFPVKTLFIVSIVVFMLGSILCASAPTSTAFIIGRAVCGFANAGILIGCFTLLVTCLPLRRRPLFTGILGAIEGAGNISSPILGGFIVDSLGWRWCFWISLPLGGATIISLFFFLENVKTLSDDVKNKTWREVIVEIDLLSTVIFLPSLTCLFMALLWAGSRYDWNSPTIIGLFCTFGALLALFIYEQHRRGDAATLPFRVLKNRSVIAGFIFSLSCNSSMNVVEYYLPTYFQTVRNYTPAQSGVLMLPSVLGFIVAMLLHGAGVFMTGYYTPFMLLGSFLMPIFAGLLTTLEVGSTLARTLVYAGLFGFAGGIGFQAPQSGVQTSLAESDASMGLAVILFAQQFGSAVFVAAAQSILTNRLVDNLSGLTPGLNSTTIEGMGLTNLRDSIRPENRLVVLNGIDKSLIQTWYLAVGLTCLTMVGSLGMEWRSVKQKQN